MDSELKPCPYCGHEGNKVTGKPGMYEILCKGCDHACFAYFHTEAMAIAAWNRRTTPQPVPVPVVPAIPDDVLEAIRDALVQRKHDLADTLEWGMTEHTHERAQLEWERLTVRYDIALEWLNSVAEGGELSIERQYHT